MIEIVNKQWWSGQYYHYQDRKNNTYTVHDKKTTVELGVVRCSAFFMFYPYEGMMLTSPRLKEIAEFLSTLNLHHKRRLNAKTAKKREKTRRRNKLLKIQENLGRLGVVQPRPPVDSSNESSGIWQDVEQCYEKL